MAVARFIIIKNVDLEGKNALIVTKQVTSKRIAEIQNRKRGQKLEKST